MIIPAEQNQFESAKIARWRTQQFQDRLEQTRNILRPALDSKHSLDWEKLTSDYPVIEPSVPVYLEYPVKPNIAECDSEPVAPVYLECPPEPQASDEAPVPLTYLDFPPEPQRAYILESEYESAYSLWADEVKRIEAENQRRYDESVAIIERLNLQRHNEHETVIAKWSEDTAPIEAENLRRREEHAAAIERSNLQRQVENESAVAKWSETVKQIDAENQRRCDEYASAIEKWNTERSAYGKKVVAEFKADYELQKPNGVKNYCKHVLKFSKFQDGSAREFDLEYIPETKILIVDYALPAPDDLVRLKEVKYIKASNEFVEVHFSENEFNRIYDDVLYQTCLRTLHELFDADTVGALSAVVFNGWVDSVDKATGGDVKGCMLSVHAKKEEFKKINLVRVDPKACFKVLNGIGSSTLHSLTPIAPVLKINRDDKRFVASYEVAGQLDERSNLAAMDWEDFEHLIRELFEKEFSKPGCEVKVTQASRDGGVDSVVLDSDPIHGGKTVIQAKRYTNTVGVASVRELYGTVLNEGAMKGILVTTADYGPDAYEFAKGKPLVLLNGANLLHLLEKHGHKAKIDIKEAKRILGEK